MMKGKNNIWITFGIFLIICVFILNILEGFISFQWENLLTISFIKNLFENISIKLIFIVTIGIIPAFLVIMMLYGIIKILPIKSQKKKRNIFHLFIITVFFGMIIIPNLHPLLESQSLEEKFYPSMVLDLIVSSHPDNPITSSFCLITYGLLIGLLLGIVASIICVGLNYDK